MNDFILTAQAYWVSATHDLTSGQFYALVFVISAIGGFIFSEIAHRAISAMIYRPQNRDFIQITTKKHWK